MRAKIILLFTISVISGQNRNINVTGNLMGMDQAGLPGCNVSLNRAKLTGISDQSGNFLIQGIVPVISPGISVLTQFSLISDHYIKIQNTKFGSKIKLSFANVRGEEFYSSFIFTVEDGKSIFNLKSILPLEGNSIFSVSIENGSRFESHWISHVNNKFIPINTNYENNKHMPLSKKSFPVQDTLSIHCDGFVDKEVELTSDVVQTGSIKIYKPSVLFISIDDLNNWIGVLGGHPQAKTPNLDGLASKGALFTKAYCNAPSCQPSRSSLMSGIPPHVSGIYNNNMAEQNLRAKLPNAVLIPKHFSNNGYFSTSGGKILHYVSDLQSWDESYPNEEDLIPFLSLPGNGSVYTYPDPRPATFPKQSWSYIEFDWGSFDLTDEQFKSDYMISEWARGQLAIDHNKPFFMAAGIFRPHLPWFAPKKYYDMHPLNSVQLPAGVLANDRDDLPPDAHRYTNQNYHQFLVQQGWWDDAVQAYLGSISYADAMVGRILDSLENSQYAQNTMVVLWSDHGWQLGEKNRWRKFMLWRQSTNVPLMFYVPKGFPGMPQGTVAGSKINQPVELLDIYKTLTELTGIQNKSGIYGNSLVPLLNNPNANWPHVALTHRETNAEYAITAGDWRYLKYANGGEELYYIPDDPWEWHNLAGVSQHSTKLTELRNIALARVNSK